MCGVAVTERLISRSRSQCPQRAKQVSDRHDALVLSAGKTRRESMRHLSEDVPQPPGLVAIHATLMVLCFVIILPSGVFITAILPKGHPQRILLHKGTQLFGAVLGLASLIYAMSVPVLATPSDLFSTDDPHRMHR